MRIKVIITAAEANDEGYWVGFCEMRGIDKWGLSEGIIDSNAEFELTLTEALELGIIK